MQTTLTCAVQNITVVRQSESKLAARFVISFYLVLNMHLLVVNAKRFSLIVFVVIVLIVRANAFNEYEDIDFELHTRKYDITWQLLNASHGELINSTEWNPNRPTRIFVHGFKSKRKVINRYAAAFLTAGDYNFIAVNWMKGSSTLNYYVAKNRVKKVN